MGTTPSPPKYLDFNDHVPSQFPCCPLYIYLTTEVNSKYLVLGPSAQKKIGY